jgi:homoserine dehydrogenase
MTRPLRLGVAGLGTVGMGVLDALQKHGSSIALRAKPIALAAVCARDRSKPRGGHDLGGLEWVNDAVKLAASPGIDVFVELIGGEYRIKIRLLDRWLRRFRLGQAE